MPHAEDQWGASIAINSTPSGGATLLGSINGMPVLNLSGTISKNTPGVDTAYLCALFVPDGEAQDVGVKAIQGHTVKSDSQSTSSSTFALGKLYRLPNDSFVQYVRSLGPDETGLVDFTVASYDADDSLNLGMQYNIYLGIKVGPHFFYTADAHADCTLPNASAYTQVTMTNACCVHSSSTYGGVRSHLLSAEATATNLPPNSATRGFLCIKQGVNLTPTEVFAKQLVPGSTPLPTTPNTLAAHPDSKVVVCAAVSPAAATFSITDLDTNNVLEPGATYDVYGYIEDGSSYYVSQNSCAITLPEVEMEVTMCSIETPQLIVKKDQPPLADTVYNFELEVNGRIVRIDNATNPIVGFVFVAADQAQDKTSICNAIEGEISRTSASGNVINVNNKDHVICIASTAITTVQDISYICDLKDGTSSYLDLTKDYRVYFWVKDAQGDGELFLSHNNQALNIFHVSSGGITGVNAFHTGNSLTIDLNFTPLSDLRNEDGAEMGISFLERSTSLTETHLRTLWNSLSVSGVRLLPNPSWRDSLMGSPQHFYGLFDVNHNSPVRITACNSADLTPETLYNLSLVLLKQQVLYCIPSTHGYSTPKYVPTAQNITSTVEISGGEKIALDVQKKHAYRIDENEKQHPLDPNNTSHKIKIRNAIDVYCSSQERRNEHYTEFGV
jgi:hypothetical protein